MQLIYVGQGRWVAGWPAADHDEADPLIYEQKLASKLYRTPEGKEQGLADLEAKAAKAKVNAEAARAAKEAVRAAREAERQATELRKQREADVSARIATAQQTLKAAEEAQTNG